MPEIHYSISCVCTCESVYVLIQTHKSVCACLCCGHSSLPFRAGLGCSLMFHSAGNTHMNILSHTRFNFGPHPLVCLYSCMYECQRGKEAGDQGQERQLGGYLDFYSMPCSEFIGFTCLNPFCLQKGKVAWSLSCPSTWCNTTCSSRHVLWVSELRKVEHSSCNVFCFFVFLEIRTSTPLKPAHGTFKLIPRKLTSQRVRSTCTGGCEWLITLWKKTEFPTH